MGKYRNMQIDTHAGNEDNRKKLRQAVNEIVTQEERRTVKVSQVVSERNRQDITHPSHQDNVITETEQKNWRKMPNANSATRILLFSVNSISINDTKTH